MTLALILLATLVSGLVSVLPAAQIEFCDVIVVNKADLVPEADLARLASILHTLNPRAKIEIARFGRVPLDRVLDTGLFDFGAASQAPGWLKEMRGEHVPETEEYGISSIVYTARRPFHPQRFWGLIHSEWEGVMRSKGYFRLASRPNSRGTGACRRRLPARRGRLLVGCRTAGALAAG